jgi:hypothetical protein
MKHYTLSLALILSTVLSGCTVYHGGVKDVTLAKDGSLHLEKCDLTVYFAFYGLVTQEDNCKTEIKPQS